jgi:hypothetical protein
MLCDKKFITHDASNDSLVEQNIFSWKVNIFICKGTRKEDKNY